ncbi:reticulon-4-interacting protein 1, mitochondrial [Trichonephila clavata]|uniref:Reticulon-4-interacting protein 1, mitochondrial n=1 Tax=Trichonephila clavata TaxID=2740835 RepID=A0A8X6FZK4_TRICU|nr:reticulon-4-interacting protein 1, mitochondrial [Trichonephila clavata]
MVMIITSGPSLFTLGHVFEFRSLHRLCSVEVKVLYTFLLKSIAGMYPSHFWRRGVLQTCRFFHSSQTCGMKTMQAWQAFEHGSPEQLQLNTAAPIPVLKSNIDVLVKVHAASVNPLDVQMLEGYGSSAFNFVRQLNSCSFSAQEFPLQLGRDFSGSVVHAGKSAQHYKIGDEIWGALSPWQTGTHAEYILAPICYISKKPKSLNHVEASSFPYVALTAWSAIKIFGGLCEKSTYGKRVLVIGATGGVGNFAVQLLKTWGADVTAICATDAMESVQNLGADAVLDYQSPEFKQNLRELNKFDVILDNVGGEYPDLTINLLKKWQNSRYITTVSPLLKNADDRGIVIGTLTSAIQASFDTAMSLKDGRTFRWGYFVPNGCALKSIAKLVDNKQINPVIEKIYKFEEVPEAFEKISRGHARGKTVIDFTTNGENKQQQQNV